MKFLGEGRVGRYLGYAIGEVVLIIVGILIALQISDWNEDRKAQAEFEQYVQQLTEDVRAAILNAQKEIENNKRYAASGVDLVKLLEQGT